jgi:hypothetical protein
LSSSHVFSLPLSGLNWRSLFPPRGSGPSFPNMAAPFTGSAHTPLPGSGTDTFRPLLEISNIFVLILSCLTDVVLHQQDHPLYYIIILTILKNGPITPFWAKDKTYLTTLSSLTLETFLHAFSLFLPTQGWEWGTKLGQVLPYPLSPAWGHGTRERQYMGLLLYLHAGFTPPPHLFTGWHGTVYLVRSSVHANAKVRMWDMGQPLQTTLVWKWQYNTSPAFITLYILCIVKRTFAYFLSIDGSTESPMKVYFTWMKWNFSIFRFPWGQGKVFNAYSYHTDLRFSASLTNY